MTTSLKPSTRTPSEAAVSSPAGQPRGAGSVADFVADAIARADAYDDPALWIFRPDPATLIAKARAVDERLASADDATEELPLAGMIFAVKDNIDVAGWPTTAACPDFAYKAVTSARAVELIETAGAICIGKTNLDQFATGLVGVRSPYGTPRNVLNPDYIPGGSSSGSAVAVAAGLADFALGTDTAGSGRVPAACNGIVGLKPTPGLVSARGVVPACRTLDCVSVFARDVSTAEHVLDVMAGYDPADAYSARPTSGQRTRSPMRRLAVPAAQWRQLDCPGWDRLFDDAIAQAERSGAEIVEIDFSVLYEVHKLVYEGPWLAERLAAVGEFAAGNPGSLHPVTKLVLDKGLGLSAADTFRGLYKLKDLARQAQEIFETCDGLLVPSIPALYTLDEIAADPLGRNSRLGYYTNFVNLLGWSALAIPFAEDESGLPFGITLIGPAFAEARLCATAERLFGDGTDGDAQPADDDADHILIGVAGAHMRGLALNHQLCDLGAEFVATAATAQSYRMHLLQRPGLPDRPGLVRTADANGCAIALEIWRLPSAKAGQFLRHVLPPLSIGTIELSDGSSILGFVCEGYAATAAKDISDYRSWREFLARSSGL